MTWLVNPHVFLAEKVIYVLIGIAGVVVSLYVGIDAHHDLQAQRKLKVNGLLRLIGQVHRRDSLRVNLPLHLLFVVLGLFSLLSPAPRALGASEAFAAIFAFIQFSAVAAQIQNQIGRLRVRSG